MPYKHHIDHNVTFELRYQGGEAINQLTKVASRYFLHKKRPKIEFEQSQIEHFIRTVISNRTEADKFSSVDSIKIVDKFHGAYFLSFEIKDFRNKPFYFIAYEDELWCGTCLINEIKAENSFDDSVIRWLTNVRQLRKSRKDNMD